MDVPLTIRLTDPSDAGVSRRPCGTVLGVDDEPATANAQASVLRRRGVDVEVASDPDEGRSLLSQRQFDVILTELAMPGNGRRWLAALRAEQPQACILVLTGLDPTSAVFMNLRALVDAAGQLWRHLSDPHRKHPLRARKGQLHRRREVASWPLRAGGRGDPVRRRSDGNAARAALQRRSRPAHRGRRALCGRWIRSRLLASGGAGPGAVLSAVRTQGAASRHRFADRPRRDVANGTIGLWALGRIRFDPCASLATRSCRVTTGGLSYTPSRHHPLCSRAQVTGATVANS